MRKANVFANSDLAGTLEQLEDSYCFTYCSHYHGAAISLTIPLCSEPIYFKQFPSFFEGLLPEGIRLEVLLKENKIDRHDYFSQLLVVGSDLVGNVTVKEVVK